MAKRIFVLMLLLNMYSVFAQKCDSLPCSSKEYRKFDFLIGKWKLSWNDSLSGIKTVTKTLDECVIYEDYIDDPKTGSYKAISFTMYNKWDQKYTQTMKDNKGSGLEFKGEWLNNKMIFVSSYKSANGSIHMMRQVYYNIKSDTMDWNWETSDDGGKNWKTEMTIHYVKIL